MLHYATLHILASTSLLLIAPFVFTSLLLITTFGYNVPISYFIIFQTFSMDFTSDEFPGHSRMGILNHSRNVLVLLELWHGARS